MIEKMLLDGAGEFHPVIRQIVLTLFAVASVVIMLRKAFGGLTTRKDYQSLIEGATRCMEASEAGSVAKKAYETVRDNLMVESITGVRVVGETRECLLKLLAEKSCQWSPKEIGKAQERLVVTNGRFSLRNSFLDHVFKYVSYTFTTLMALVLLVQLVTSPIVWKSLDLVIFGHDLDWCLSVRNASAGGIFSNEPILFDRRKNCEGTRR